MGRRLLLALIVMLCAARAGAQTANFTWSPLTGCSPAIITFSNTSTGTVTGTTYAWNFGNGTTSALQNPSTTFTSPGTYTVTLTVTNSGSSPNTKSATITIYGPPTILFSYNKTSGCAPLGVQFTSTITANAPGSLTYSWNFGDGTSSSLANPLHSYTVANTYTVTLTVTNGQGCAATLVLSSIITVYGKPSTSVSTLQSLFCAIPASVAFSASSTTGTGPYQYMWNYGDGTGSGTGSSPTHTYAGAGIYTVTVETVDANGCKDSLVLTNFITTRAKKAGFVSPAMGCDSTPVTFTDTTTGGTLAKWAFGDGKTDSGSVVAHTYTAPGTYNVRMITDVNGCIDTVFHSIVVHPKPVATISHDIPCPPPIAMQFTATSSVPATYQWGWRSGGSDTGASVPHYYSTAQTDSAYVIATSQYGCTDTVVMDTVYVLDIAIIRTTSPFKGCVPFATQFSFGGPFTKIPCFPATTIAACPYPYPIVSSSWTVTSSTGSKTTTGLTAVDTLKNVGGLTGILTFTTANGCVFHDTSYVIGGTKVPPSFYATPDTVCVKQLVTFTNTTGDSSIRYDWIYGEPDTAGGYHGHHRYKVPGLYTIKLISDFNGCRDTIIRPNYILVNPSNAQFRDSLYCPPSKTVQFIDTSIGALTHYWDFGDGNTSTTASPLHTYAAYGTYAAYHITTNSVYGCADTVVDTLRIVPVLLNFAATDTTLCLGDLMHLSGTYSGPPVDSFGWGHDGIWEGDSSGNKVTIASFTHDSVFANPGYHTISMRIYNYNKRCSTIVTKPNYIIIGDPVASFVATPLLGCTPMLVTFSDSSFYTPGTQPFNRTWTFGNGAGASNNNPATQYTYTAPGKYSVKLKVTDWIGCADSLTIAPYIEARHPKASYIASKYAACKGESILFNNYSSGATGLRFFWSFGDGDTSVAVSPSHTYSSTGSYTITLIATDSTGCADTVRNTGVINISKPTASFTQSDTLAICVPTIVSFNAAASTGYSSLSWTFGNASVATQISPVTTYTAPGVYAIRLIAKDGAGCTDTANASMRVLGYAGALTYTPHAGCWPLEVTFTSSVTNVPVLVWDFADGDTALAVGATIKHTYTTPGAYLPKIVYSNNVTGCSASSLGLDTIKVDGVIAGFKALPPCERTTIMLVDTSFSYFSPKTYWYWRFDNGQTASGASVPHLYPTAGKYPVTLYVTNARGCKDSITRDIVIHPLPVITASADTAVCVPDAVAISASGGVSYVWSPSSSLSCAACPTPAAGPTTPTTYLVIGTDSNGCANRDTVKIGIQTKTTFTTKASGEICLGDIFQLTAQGATLYSWAPAATLDSPLSSHPIAKPSSNTTYIVTGKEGSCLTDTHSVRVIVRPLPTAYAGEDLKVVAGKGVLLQASGQGIHHVLWSPDSTLSCANCYAPEAKPKVATTYVLTTYTEYGCEATDSMRVVVLCDGSQLFIPNTFTPNADGMNDYFYPRGQGLASIKSMRIYSRWGEKVYEAENVSLNDERRGWNGAFAGRQMNPDTYVYIIEAVCDTGSPISWKGDVTLVR